MGLKGKIEAIIYAAEEPITLEQIAFLMKESVLQELAVERATASEEAANEEAAAQSEAEPFVVEVVSAVDLEPAADGTEVVTEVYATPTQDTSVQESASVDADAETVATPETTDAAPVRERTAAQAEAFENVKPVVASRRKKNEVPPEVRARVRELIRELITDCANADRGIEVRQLAGGYRMATKPEHHDIVKAFAKSLKPPLRLSLPALETLAVVAYKQPVTAPEVSEIRGVDSQGVMATLLERKLVTTAGRKAVIGRPILYKTTKEFLLRFGLNDTSELPSMEEFEKLAQKEFFSAEAENEPAGSPDEEPSMGEEELDNEPAGAEGLTSSAPEADADGVAAIEAEREDSQAESHTESLEQNTSEVKSQD